MQISLIFAHTQNPATSGVLGPPSGCWPFKPKQNFDMRLLFDVFDDDVWSTSIGIEVSMNLADPNSLQHLCRSGCHQQKPIQNLKAHRQCNLQKLCSKWKSLSSNMSLHWESQCEMAFNLHFLCNSSESVLCALSAQRSRDQGVLERKITLPKEARTFRIKCYGSASI